MSIVYLNFMANARSIGEKNLSESGYCDINQRRLTGSEVTLILNCLGTILVNHLSL
jgi:hypothetical protein